MAKSGRFRNAFKLSELQQLNAAHSDECAVLFLSPASFAVLGWLVEVVFWESFLVDDISVDEFDRAGDELRWRIYSEMGYTVNLDEQLERMAVAQERIADNLEADDGEGGVLSLVAVLLELLPLLAASADIQEDMLLSSLRTELTFDDMLRFMNGAAGPGSLPQLLTTPVNFDEVTAALGTLSLTGQCCEPNPTANGLVALPSRCVGLSIDDGRVGNNYVRTVVSNTVVDYESVGADSRFVARYSGYEENEIVRVSLSFAVQNNDSGRLRVSLANDGFSGTFTEIYDQTGSSGSGGEGEIAANANGYVFVKYENLGAVGDVLRISGTVCTVPESEQPEVIVSLNDGIGTLEGYGWIHSAGIWTLTPNVPAVIKAEITEAVETVQLDWTRPINGTVTVETYSGGSIVDTVNLDGSEGRGGIVDTLSDTWDELKVKIVSAGAQALGDLVVWAYGNN